MKPVARIAASLVAAVAPTGCAHSLSTTAIAGDKVISEAEVIKVVNSYRKVSPQIKRLDMLFPLILGGIAGEVSPKLRQTIGAAELRAAMEADPDTFQVLGTPCQKIVEGKLKMRYLQASVDVEAVLRKLLRVEINPRYGAWSPRGIDRHGGSILVETKSWYRRLADN